VWFTALVGELSGERWPDGEPVTPWADPWHDVLGDILQFKRDAEASRHDPYWPYQSPDGSYRDQP
jgi:hypothetical protein